MNREIFLRDLRIELACLSLMEQEEIIDDYIITFDSKNEEGLSDEEIIRQLGNPKVIAKQFLDELGYDDSVNHIKDNKENNIKNRSKAVMIIVFDLLLGMWLYITVYLANIAALLACLSMLLAPYVLFIQHGLNLDFTSFFLMIFLIGIGLTLIQFPIRWNKKIISFGKKHINWIKSIY